MLQAVGGFVEHPFVWPRAIERRPYQLAIAENAKKANTLVILPTALGKTVIAALVAAHILYNYRSSRVLILAPTRPLVIQHRDTLARLLRVRADEVAVLTGRILPAFRERVWSDPGVRLVLATPQTCQNDLEEGRASLRGFGLVIFDEAHRAVKRYAYPYIAKRYMNECPWPLILATTATPGASPERIRAICRALGIEQVEYRGEGDLDVAGYAPTVELSWVVVELPREYLKASAILREMIDKKVKELARFGLAQAGERITKRRLLDLRDQLMEAITEARGAGKGPLFGALLAQSATLTLLHALELLETQGAHQLALFLDRLEEEARKKRAYARIVKDELYARLKALLQAIDKVEHPKLSFIKAKVQEQLRENPNSRIMMFTQYRDTANLILEAFQGMDGIRAEKLVGQSFRGGDPGLSQEEQAKVLRAFKEGRINLCIATSVGEEGIDVPGCDLVIFYEPVPSEIRHIQRKGRTGRRGFGRVIVLVAKDTVDIAHYRAAVFKAARLKRLVREVNATLKPISRPGQPPEPSPMDPQELPAERASFAERKWIPIGPMLEPSEKAAPPMGEERLEEAKAYALSRLKGSEGGSVPLERLLEEAEGEGYGRPVMGEALRTLAEEREAYFKEGLVVRVGSHTAFPFELEVKRVEGGLAQVALDGSIRAALSMNDYPGPKEFIRRGARMKVKGWLYKGLDGQLYISVMELVEFLGVSQPAGLKGGQLLYRRASEASQQGAGGQRR